jgi:hypothetical protein
MMIMMMFIILLHTIQHQQAHQKCSNTVQISVLCHSSSISTPWVNLHTLTTYPISAHTFCIISQTVWPPVMVTQSCNCSMSHHIGGTNHNISQTQRRNSWE